MKTLYQLFYSIIILLVVGCTYSHQRDYTAFSRIRPEISTKEDVIREIGFKPTAIYYTQFADSFLEVWEFSYIFHGILGSTKYLIPVYSGTTYPGYNKIIGTSIYFYSNGIVKLVNYGDRDFYQRPYLWNMTTIK
jgi:hypothetical protein